MLRSLNFLHNKYNWKDIKVSVIVSTGRTGTKYFAQLFSSHKNYIAKHEPAPICNVQGFSYLKGEIGDDELMKFLLKGRKKIYNEIRKAERNSYLESNGGLIFLIPFLDKIFPNLRVAHIIRDPRDIVRSGCSRTEELEGELSLKYENENSWLIKSYELPNDKYKDHWHQMDMPERFMWMWNLKNQYADNIVQRSEAMQTFRFEDVFSDELQMANIIDFLSFENEAPWTHSEIKERIARPVNQTTQFQFPDYDDWSLELRDKLEQHCGVLMKKYKYN